MTIHSNSRIKGFSLLEVLIAVVIMSVGLLALATLQMGVVRSSAEAKAQTVAVNAARDKLEELVSYKVVNEATGVACPTANDSYQCLTGSNDTFTGDGGAVFTRTWTVDRCVGNQATGAFTCGQANTAAWTAAVPRNEFKTITVTVGWTDVTGPQTLVVKDAISALNPSDIALVQRVVKGLKPRPAIARIWDPGTVSGVIPIAVGGGSSSAATNPKPEVIVGNSVVETRFDVLTYAGLSGGAADAQARVETAIVGCTCSFASIASTARGLRPTYWDGTRYSIPVPTAAAPPAQAATGVTQSKNCEVCCRDHHDPTGTTTAKFSPFLSTHGHYNANAIGTVAVTSGNYKEACRLIRVEGVFRTAADMNNDYFALLATEDLSSASNYGGSSIPDNTATISYQQFVVDYMDDRFTRKANSPSPANASAADRAAYNSYRTTTPCVSGSCTLEVQNLAGVARVPTLNQPASIDIGSSDVKWNHSRGLFIDYLEPEAIQVITNAKTNCLAAVNTTGFSDCVLKYLPFTSINLTEIADWSSLNTSQVVVTNNDYSDSIDEDDPVRGKTMWGISPVTNSSVNVLSKSRKSNSGLLDLSFEAISYDDSIAAVDSQPFIVQGTNGNPGQNGSFRVDLLGTTGSTPAVTYVTGVQSSQACNAGNGQNYLTNTCSVTNANSGSGLGVPNSMKVVALNYNAQVDGQNNGATTAAGDVTCYDATGMNPLSVPAGEKYTAHTCKNYSVTTATIVSSGGVAGAAGTVLSSGVDGTLSEKTTISFPLINSGDVITVTFGTPVTTSPALTCSYATQQNGNINYTVTQADCAP